MFFHWFAALRIRRVSGRCVVIDAPTQFHRNCVVSHYLRSIEAAITDAWGLSLVLDVEYHNRPAEEFSDEPL